MRRKKGFCSVVMLLALMVLESYAQTTITGTVKSSTSGAVIAGANVSLKNLGIAAQSGADGKFTLVVTTSARPFAGVREPLKPFMVGSALYFTAQNSGEKIRVDVFNALGVRCASPINVCGVSGSYKVTGLTAHLLPGMFMAQLSIGNELRSFAMPVVKQNAVGVNMTRIIAPASMAKQCAVVDSIVTTKSGYVRNATPLSQYSGDVTIVLDSAGPSPSGDVVGKVIVGYQGWFSCKGDGSPINSWGHMNLEMWPDVREYFNTYSGCPFQQAGVVQPAYTGTLGNGEPATMFSSYSQQTMNTHFLWMQQNGIDCAALQIFGSYLRSGGSLLAFHTGVAQHMMAAAETYGRKFYIMYDVSSTDAFDANWINTMVNSLHVTSSPAYARQNGKPVVCFWGVGTSGRGAISTWVTKIDWFKAQGCYVIGGALQGWRSSSDMSCYNACDMIMPWMVGRTSGTPLPYFESWYKDDLAYCKAHGIDYQADIYPGTGFYNSNSTWPKNKIPRMHGDFMWSQFAAATQTGVKSVYISMFDEAQEATSIFKCAEDSTMIPKGKYFLTLDADGVHVSSDFYLRLVNNGGRMVKGLIPYQATHSTPFVQ